MKVRKFEMKIELWDVNNTYRAGSYSSFEIEGPESNYRLHLGQYSSHTHSHLLDSFSLLANEQEFSTEDADHDQSFDWSCASLARGPGWFSNCYMVNLFGMNYNSRRGPHGSGIYWHHFHGFSNSLRRVIMSIRPIAANRRYNKLVAYTLSNVLLDSPSLQFEEKIHTNYLTDPVPLSGGNPPAPLPELFDSAHCMAGSRNIFCCGHEISTGKV
eukprot:TCALIF_07361-PA protein Name:"Similar to ANGPTL7 Angiopoietin-related protein 7 (Bos taurus)" AED:0.06 eAED:0.09 QI:4/0.66/0.25/1/1/0.75/4/0/213